MKSVVGWIKIIEKNLAFAEEVSSQPLIESGERPNPTTIEELRQ